jgi:hypothetical protein
MAALWIGASVFTSALLAPVINGIDPAGDQLMMRLNRHGLHLYMAVIAVTTLVTGIYLFWRFTGGFDPSVSASHAGLAFGLGGAAGILAGIVGGTVVGRNGRKLTDLLSRGAPASDGGLRRQMDQLRWRIKVGTRLVIALQTTALVFMAVGHYV